jgi:7-cyano-7-deazaguanine synthase
VGIPEAFVIHDATPMTNEKTDQAVLVSGGLDSAILTAEIASRGVPTTPLYVRTHLGWEEQELNCLHRFLQEIARPNLKSLAILELPVRDLYGNHWSMTGNIPDAAAPDESFYLPGRNVILLSKALLWCCLHRVPTLSMGILGANPFPDATPEFFQNFAKVVGDATGSSLEISTPYASLSKREVVLRGRSFPLEHTLSCMSPVRGQHCGICGKCAERGRAFLEAGVPDRTTYLSDEWKSKEQAMATTRPWE